MAAEQLSGTIVVIIIAIGVQACIMTFIFVKRQIQRFTLRNRRGPHLHLGQGAPKPLRRDNERQLDYIPYIRYEPKVCTNPDLNPPNPPEHFFRSKAVERFHALETEITAYSHNYTRLPGTNVRSFLLNCVNGPLLGIESRDLHVVCDEYEHARHHYAEFNKSSLELFTGHLAVLHGRLVANRACKPHPSPMPLGSTSPGKRERKRRSVTKPSGLAASNGQSGSSGNVESVPMTVYRGKGTPADTTVSAGSGGGNKAAAV